MLRRRISVGLLLLATGCATLQPSAASSCAEESKEDQSRLIAWYEKERMEMWYEARELKRDMRALKALLDILIEREQYSGKEGR